MYITSQVWAPAGLRGACSGRSKSRRAGSYRGLAFRRPAKQDRGNPHNTNDQQVFACSDVLLCMTARTSPRRLAISHLERGHLANSYRGSPRVLQQQSRFDSILRATVLSWVYFLCLRGGKSKYFTTSGANVFGSATVVVDPCIEG